MRYLAFSLIFFCSVFITNAQYNIKWGNDLKLDRSVTDMQMISADSSGSYFVESEIVSRRIQTIFDTKAMDFYLPTLLKFGNNAEQIYSSELRNLSKDYDLISITPINNKLYFFGSVYSGKEGAYKVYTNEIDKNTGRPIGNPAEIGNYLISKQDYKHFARFHGRIIKNSDNSYLLVTELGFVTNVRLGIVAFDGSMHQTSVTEIPLPYPVDLYTLWDVRVAGDKLVIFEKLLRDEIDDDKKYLKVFKNFNITIYDLKGTKIKDIPLDKPGSFVLEGKFFSMSGNQVALTGFYSKSVSRKNLDGFFVRKLDLDKNELSAGSVKDISSGMLGRNYSDDEDEESNKQRKQREKIESTMDNYVDHFLIKSVEVNPVDGSYMIAAEMSDISNTYQRWETNNRETGRLESVRTLYTFNFRNKDMVFVSASKEGAINWMTLIPKKQEEFFMNEYVGFINGLFGNPFGRPFYSSFNSGFLNNHYIVLYNDNKSNTKVTKAGDKASGIFNFQKRGELFSLTFDITGKVTKSPLSDCALNDVILMPGHSVILGNNVIIPASREKTLGKTQFKIARVNIN